MAVAVEGNLGGDQVIGGVLRVAPGIGGRFADGDGGIDVAGQVVFAHLAGELLELRRDILVEDHVAVGTGGGDVFGPQADLGALSPLLAAPEGTMSLSQVDQPHCQQLHAKAVTGRNRPLPRGPLSTHCVSLPGVRVASPHPCWELRGAPGSDSPLRGV